ncbi:MAG: hypothetical protein IJH55_03905 [Romboutsia sp.]|nr:hypothetical protein [Romboutsia sp.]
MNNNYWKEYWDSYYKFIDFYINKLQNVYPNEDIEERYIEVAKLFEPSIRPNNYIPPVIQTGNQVQWPGAQSWGIYGQCQGMQQGCQGQGTQQGNQGQGQGMQQGGQGQGMQQGDQGQGQVTQQGGQGQGQGSQQWGQGPGPAISPGGGQFTINNCKKMSVVRIVMRSGFNPSTFYMLVDRTDRRSIQGYRIANSDGRIRFIPMSVEYRNINFIECVF